MSYTQATLIGSNVFSQICQMPNNATSIGSNVSSQICQMPNNATSIGSASSCVTQTNFNASSPSCCNSSGIACMVVHTKHAGCHEISEYDEFGPVTTYNPPSVFLFNSRESAIAFFSNYVYTVKCTHPRCSTPPDNGEFAEDCGMISFDEEDQPSCYQDHTNQIYIMECGAQLFVSRSMGDINELNKMRRQKKNGKSFSKQKKEEMIEIGKMCEESM